MKRITFRLDDQTFFDAHRKAAVLGLNMQEYALKCLERGLPGTASADPEPVPAAASAGPRGPVRPFLSPALQRQWPAPKEDKP